MPLTTAMRRTLFLVGLALAILLIAASWIWPRYYYSTWPGLALLFALTVNLKPRMAFLVGGIIGAGALFIAFHWVPDALYVSLDLGPWSRWFSFAGMMVYEAIPFAIIAYWVSRWLEGSLLRMWGTAVIWVAFEVYWPKVFPWSFAHTQTDALPLLQIAELIGAPGISFVMISVALIPATYLRLSRGNRENERLAPVIAYSGLALSLLAAVLLFGLWRQSVWEDNTASRPVLRVALVQVDPNYNDSIAKMRKITLAMDDACELVCWPESTLGNYCSSLSSFRDEEITLANSLPPIVDLQPTSGISCPVLAGGKLFSPGASDEGPFLQTGFLLQPDQAIAGRYLKRTLMPVGEYIPGETIFPSLRRIAGLQDTILTGNDSSPLELRKGVSVGVLLCYDDMVAANARKTVTEGAQLLVTLANGSAFKNPLTLEQHMRLSLLRAVENRRFFVRCAATGVSCVITPTGRIVDRADTNVETALKADVALVDYRTVYNRWGFLFAPTCLVIAILMSCEIMLSRVGLRVFPKRAKPDAPPVDAETAGD